MRRVACSCALAAAVVVAFSVAPAAPAANRRDSTPTVLWKSYPLAPHAKAVRKAAAEPPPATPPDPQPKPFTPPPTPKAATTATKPTAATPPEPRSKARTRTALAPRPRAASYEIATGKSGFPRQLLLGVFLTSLLLVVSAVVVWGRLAPLRERRRLGLTERSVGRPGDDLLVALQPNPAPMPVLEPAVAERPRPVATLRPHPPPVEPTVARCEVKLWRGFARCHLYAVGEGSGEPIAFSRYFRLREDGGPSSEARQAFAELIDDLEQDGWTVVADGPGWYERRLERRT